VSLETYDNARSESLFSRYKAELLEGGAFTNVEFEKRHSSPRERRKPKSLFKSVLTSGLQDKFQVTHADATAS
jgi:hypothetical protein